MKYLYFVSIFLLHGVVYSQIKLSGRVVDEQKQAVAFASITVENPDNGLVLAFEMTDDNGEYHLTIVSELSELTIRLSNFNYSTQVTTVKNKTQLLDFIAVKEVTQLREIVIKAAFITQRNDTISYDLNAFAGKNDRVLADVLKKIPGIEVDPLGRIKYQGKEINEFLVDGKDLMGGAYASITEALPHAAVSKLEVIENNQPIKMLQGKVASENAGINIKLKKDVTITGSADLGVGAEPALWKAKVSPLLFHKKVQLFVNAESNNVGNDLFYSLSDFSVPNSFDSFFYQSNTGQNLSIAETPLPSLADKRYLFNTSHLGAVNVLTNVSKDTEMRVNAYYLNDALTRDGSESTEIRQLDSDGKTQLNNTYTRVNKSAVFTERLKAVVAFTKNSKKGYLKEALTFQLKKAKNRGVLAINGDPLSQTLSSPSFSLQNTFSTLMPLDDKRFINFKSLIHYDQDHQDYQIEPIVNESFDDQLLKLYTNLDQVLRDNSFSTKNEASFSWQLDKLLLTALGGLELTDRNYNSQLFGVSTDRRRNLIGATYLNDLQYFSAVSKAELKLNYKRKRISWNLQLPLRNYHIEFKDKTLANNQELNKPVIEPAFYGQYDFNAFWKLSLSGVQQYRFAGLDQLYPNFVLSQLNFSSYNSEIWESKYQIAQLGMEYKNPINRVFGNIRYAVSREAREVLFTRSITENGQQIVDVIARDNVVKDQGASVTIGKFFSDLGSNASVTAGLDVSENQFIVNQKLLGVKTNSYNATLKVNNNYWSWLDFNYQLSYRDQKRNESSLLVRDKNFEQKLGADVFPVKNHSLGINLDYNEYHLSDQQFVNRFLDLRYRFNWVSKRVDFNLQWDNILNTKLYEEAVVNDVLTSVTTFKLRPSQIVFSVKFNIK